MAKPRRNVRKKRPVEQEVQRRILDVFNQARYPKELIEHPLVALKAKDAKAALAHRATLGAFGYTSIDHLLKIPRIDPKIIGRLVALFGPATFGQWADPIDLTRPDGVTAFNARHAVLLRNGTVLFIGATGGAYGTLLWDPENAATPTALPDNQPDDNLFCSGHSFLSDGTLLVIGGGGGSPGSEPGTGWKFDPADGTNGVWTETAGTVKVGRWYPTTVTLGGRRVLIVDGSSGTVSNVVDEMEIYRESGDTFDYVTDPPGKPDASKRSFPPLYPGLHLLPGGEVFYSRTGWRGTDPSDLAAYFRFTGFASGEWIDIADPMEYPYRTKGMSVLLLEKGGPQGWMAKILVIGGGTADEGQATSELLPTAALSPMWEEPAAIGENRSNVNAVLLPDGTIFIVGGMSGLDTPCRLYDPATDVWSLMANVHYERAYHSVALLLPDGKVMVTGGGSTTIELFSPPYLFRGTRPTIPSSPTVIHHGETFQVESPQASDIEKVVLVRPMAVTHQTDTEQRVIPLTFTKSGTTLDVTAPNGRHPHHIAPRGYYMLFILNGNGVPSEGKFVLLH